jgi:DNA-binding CsgD family transcriptional regulator
MLGRERELSLIGDLLDGVRGGTSASLLISGEPGIGKTELLARARAAAGDTLVLETVGVEGGSHLAFTGLAELLDPVLNRIDGLAEPQAAALRGALALGPPVAGDRFTAYVAVLGVLAAAAETRPVVCIVDDAHWLDAESLEALVFVARRLGAEGVAILFGSREGVSERLDRAPLPRLRPARLADADARRLIAASASVAPSATVLDRLVAGAAGNPLALIELGRALMEEQLTGRVPLPDPLPVGAGLAQALLRPVLDLPAPTRRALLVASAGDGDAALLAAALAVDGLTMAELEPAERAGAIRLGPTGAAFAHPLLRAAVHQVADPAERRAAHAAHARAAGTLGEAALDRRAWHLAQAASGPDADVAAALEEAARRAAARTAYAGASAALEAAARLSPEPADRGRRLGAAGQSALAAGDFARGGRLFDEVVALEADPGQVVEALAGRGFVETHSGSAPRAVEILVGAAERVAPVAPAAAAALLVEAIVPAFMHNEMSEALALAERAAGLVAGGTAPVAAVAEVAGAVVSTFSGMPRQPSPAALAEVARIAEHDPRAGMWMFGTLQCLMLSERYAEAEAGLEAVIRAARERSTPFVLPIPLFTRAEVRRRLGRLTAAAADAGESLRFAEETGQPATAGLARWALALIDAVRGRADESRTHVERMLALRSPSQAENLDLYASHALGLLALSEGDLEEALERLSDVRRRHEAAGGSHHPLLHTYEQELAEVQVRLGRVDEARATLDALEARGRRTGTPWPAAAASRCRGLLAPDGDYEELFAGALALHQRTPTPFERARTELCLGERRRLGRRVREAREPLASALAAFEAMGAVPWAERARRELRATGARPGEARAAPTRDLTSQELQVVLLIAGGATNKEAAAALFISPKTVEYHLGKAFDTLGVRSRAALVALVARDAMTEPGPTP